MSKIIAGKQMEIKQMEIKQRGALLKQQLQEVIDAHCKLSEYAMTYAEVTYVLACLIKANAEEELKLEEGELKEEIIESEYEKIMSEKDRVDFPNKKHLLEKINNVKDKYTFHTFKQDVNTELYPLINRVFSDGAGMINKIVISSGMVGLFKIISFNARSAWSTEIEVLEDLVLNEDTDYGDHIFFESKGKFVAQIHVTGLGL